MSDLYKINNNCRLCHSTELSKIVSIGNSPVSEKYINEKGKIDQESLVPLDLFICNSCYHVQLIHIVNPDYLWSDFTFKTSRNKKIENHYEDYIERLLSFLDKTKINFVLDIGSNDGTLLELFKNKGIKKYLGIDPASNVVKEAIKKGIPSITGYMNFKNAKKILSEYGKANLITANNVYAHINDMDEVTDAIREVLSDDGLFVFEVSYLLDVIEKKLLGTVFHEHLSYHSLTPLLTYLKKRGLEIVDVKRNDLQGGSIVCYAQHKSGKYKVSENVNSLLKIEKEFKINEKETYKNFAKSLENQKKQINLKIREIKKQGLKIIGFGSARSATTLIKYFDIASQIEFIVDDNKDKHYKFTPGDQIQVLPSENIYKHSNSYVIIFAWEHSSKIIKKHQKFLDSGGKFINIFPNIEIIKK